MITIFAAGLVFALAAWFLSSRSEKPVLNPTKYADKVRVPVLGGAELQVMFEDLPEGDAHAQAALKAFLAHGDKERVCLEQAIFEYYGNMRRRAAGNDPVEIATPSDVWEHVDLRGIGITTETSRKDVFVRVFGECEWEPEHGLQIVYHRGNTLTRVGPEDGHLT